jgi:hypothetical protein
MMPMSSRTREGLAILAAGIALGVAADVLAHTVPERLNVAVGLGALALVFGSMAQRGLISLPPKLAPIGVLLGLLCVALVWRDSPTLFALNLLGMAGLLTLASPRVVGKSHKRAGLADYAWGAGQMLAGVSLGGVPLLLSDIEWRSLPHEGKVRVISDAALGLVAAVPVITVFGGLLMDSDPVFSRLMSDAFRVKFDFLVEHGFAVCLWSWSAAGLLRVFTRIQPESGSSVDSWAGRLRLGQVATVVGLVDLLFLAFGAVQFRYLFGGADLVRQVTGLSYAEYARSGFFELVAVVALSLPLLLFADWTLDREDRRGARLFRRLACLMLVLLNVMLASALFRMRLYTLEYGLTELRFYTMAFMGWLVLVFGWFAATVLRGRRSRFAFGALSAALLVLLTLNLLNPDGMIAATNLSRAAAGRQFDPAYTAALSADALPILRRDLHTLPRGQACVLATILENRWESDFAAANRWDMSYVRARRAPWVDGAARCPSWNQTQSGGVSRPTGVAERGTRPHL